MFSLQRVHKFLRFIGLRRRCRDDGNHDGVTGRVDDR